MGWIYDAAGNLTADGTTTYSGGTFGAYLGTLRRNGLVELDGGEVRASGGLFVEASLDRLL